jgi:hypothetical protein
MLTITTFGDREPLKTSELLSQSTTHALPVSLFSLIATQSFESFIKRPAADAPTAQLRQLSRSAS